MFHLFYVADGEQCVDCMQEEEAAAKRAQFEEAKREAHQKVQEYEAMRKEAAAVEGDVRDKSRLIEQKQHEIEDEKVWRRGT